MPGPPELILILLIVLVVFGAGRIPQIGDALGKGIRNFKRAVGSKDEIDVTPEPAKSIDDGGERDGVVDPVASSADDRDAGPSA